jgi:hypothetical protein
MKSQYKRVCSYIHPDGKQCGNVITYTSQWHLLRAQRNGTFCNSCCKRNRIFDDATRRKIGAKKKRIMPEYLSNIADYQRRQFSNWCHGQHNGFEEYIGIPIDAFKAWIQSKFQRGMNWNNHSFRGWHYEHQFPLSSFDLRKDSEVKKAWNFANIFPEWSKVNLSKGSKRHPSQDFLEY